MQASGVSSFQHVPVILCHWMLSPHFTIHLNGFVPSFSVNLFYKKVLCSQQHSCQDPALNQGILGYAEKMEREEANGWVISVPATSSLLSGCFERGGGGVMLWLKMEFLLSCLPSAQESCWKQSTSVPVKLSSCLAQHWQLCNEPGSHNSEFGCQELFFLQTWGNGLIISQRLLIFSTCSHLSVPPHPMEAGNFSSHINQLDC